jgi:hypothetical protein
MKLTIEQEFKYWRDAFNIDSTLPFSEQLLNIGALLILLSKKNTPDPLLLDGNPTAIVGCFMQKYLQKKSKVYKIGDNFGYQLNKTNINLPCSLIPYEANKQYWIEFPSSLTFESQDCYFKSACITMMRTDTSGEYKDYPSLLITARDFNKDGKICDYSSQVYFPLDPDKTLAEVIELTKNMRLPNTFSFDKTKEIIPTSMIEYIAKCLVYIESGDPDIQSEKGNPPLTKKPKKIKRHLEDFCPFDIVRVGYSFHGRTKHTDSWSVSGHFRWQPCGSKLTQVKLIWIDEHDRGWKNV